MWIKKRTYEGMVENINVLTKSMGVIMSDIAQYYPADYNRENPYKTKQAQVSEIYKKYQGTANFGNQILPRIVNLRVAFSIPNRLLITPSEEGNKASKTEVESAKDFLNAFMEFNGLDSSLPRDFAKESEFSGEVLVRIKWDNNEKLPKIYFYPWKDTGYKVEKLDEFAVVSKLKASYTHDGSEVQIPDSQLGFIAFNDKLNECIGYPTAGGILKDIENLDKDLRDWRKLNHLFAHPTPHFKCETPEQAKAISSMITSTGWKVGTAIATSADFNLKGPTGAESNLLMLAIQTGAKVISAHTGIGIHFLGFANVMSNRATADSMGEPTEVVLHSEIASWKKFYEELFKKAIQMRNENLNRAVGENLMTPRLIPLTDRQWRHLKDIYMAAAKDKLLSTRTFLDNIPNIDVDAELERLEEEDTKRREKQKELMEQQQNGEQENNNSNTPPGQKNRESNENDV